MLLLGTDLNCDEACCAAAPLIFLFLSHPPLYPMPLIGRGVLKVLLLAADLAGGKNCRIFKTVVFCLLANQWRGCQNPSASWDGQGGGVLSKESKIKGGAVQCLSSMI